MECVALCRVDTLIEGQSYGFDPLHEGRDRVFALRYRGRVRVYLNSCPHLHVALQYRKDRYLSADGERIVCYAHGAQFLPDSGEFVYGPCLGQVLTSLVVSEQDGCLLLATGQLA